LRWSAREAIKALIVANHFPTGYARGKLLPRDRKDWYD
jgi:hypothetical protein